MSWDMYTHLGAAGSTGRGGGGGRLWFSLHRHRIALTHSHRNDTIMRYGCCTRLVNVFGAHILCCQHPLYLLCVCSPFHTIKLYSLLWSHEHSFYLVTRALLMWSHEHSFGHMGTYLLGVGGEEQLLVAVGIRLGGQGRLVVLRRTEACPTSKRSHRYNGFTWLRW
jgi:hypothetical protein